jgi:hypothetical protein
MAPGERPETLYSVSDNLISAPWHSHDRHPKSLEVHELILPNEEQFGLVAGRPGGYCEDTNNGE